MTLYLRESRVDPSCLSRYVVNLLVDLVINLWDTSGNITWNGEGQLFSNYSTKKKSWLIPWRV